MKRILPTFLLVFLMFFCTVQSFAQEKAAQKADETTKKVSLIRVGEPSTSTSFALEDVEVSDYYGIKCLKGKYVNMTWVANKTVYIPVDKITVVVEYDSYAQYKEALGK